MKLLIFLLFFFNFDIWACSQSVDTSKVMLFIDTNFSDLEIETARKTACQRGERLVVVPQNYKDYSTVIKKANTAMNRLSRCQNNCESVTREYAQAQSAVLELREKEVDLKSLIDQELKKIGSTNGKVSNLILSGHDGGGHFGGHKGSISRDDIEELMEENSHVNEVSTLMLLGCYTGVQNEIIHWKGIFPKIRMIGGYDGSAPLSDKPMGHHYLEDLLLKEKSLLAQADQKKLNQYVKANIRGLHSMHSAVYLEPVCEEDQEATPMYYGSLTNKNFSTFDLDQCLKEISTIKNIEQQFSKLDSGEIEPPRNPSAPEIKPLYDKARSLEHCLTQLESEVNVNSLFNLRFYEAVKESFSSFYSEEIKKADDALKSTSWDEILNQIDRDQENIGLVVESLKAENELLKTNPDLFFLNLDSQIKQKESELNSILSDKTKLEILNKLQDPSAKLNLGDELLYDQYIQLKKEVSDLTGKSFYRNSHQQLISSNEYEISHKENSLNYTKFAINAQRENPVWMPTAENLKKHTRKELKNNIHRISGLLSLDYLPRKTRLALEWSVKAQEEHLVHFQNPFEWHEVSPRIEPPNNVIGFGEEIYGTMNLGNTFFSPSSSPLPGTFLSL